LKIFSGIGLHKKITKDKNAIVTEIRQHPVAVAEFQQACLAGSSQNGWIPPNPVRSGRLLTMAEFRPVSARI
jgi:hypothetical protein